MNRDLEIPKEEQVELASVVRNSEEMQVKTYEQVMDAADLLLDVKSIGEKITERKEKITKPMNEALKSVRSFFKKPESDYAKAEDILKEKVLSWHSAHWEEQTVQDNTIHGLRGKVTVVERFRVEIEDATKIPRELCSPDTGRIQSALEAGLKVKGAKLVPYYSITAGKN